MKKTALIISAFSLFLCGCTTSTQAKIEVATLPTATPVASNAFPKASVKHTITPKVLDATSEDTDLIKQYLANNLGVTSKVGKVFAAYEILGKDEKEGMTEMYVWALIEERIKQEGEIKKGNIHNTPVSLTLMEQGEGLQVISHKEDKASLPDEIQKGKMFDPDQIYNKQVVARLEESIDGQAKQYFQVN